MCFPVAWAAAAFLASVAPRSPALAPDTLHYTALSFGNPKGAQTVVIAPDGSRQVRFVFNDRGRGPDLLEELRLARDGRPAHIRITGVDYFKNRVEEQFDRAAGRSRWRNAAEQGESADAGAIYTSFDGTPEELAVLARALRGAPGGSLALLPAGRASIRAITDRRLARGRRAHHVTLYAIDGLQLTPTYVWLDRGGALFAAGRTWLMTVRQGWEQTAAELVATQDSVDTGRGIDLARRLTRKPTRPLAFTGVTVFDAERAVARPGMTVVVDGSRIAAVGPAEEVVVPPDAERIDATGRTLLPGLWDMHVHASDEDGLMHVAAGITSVRDMANDVAESLQRVRRFDDGTLIGPRLLLVGFIDGPGPYAAPTRILAATEAEGRAFVAMYDSLGYRQIKLYSSLDTAIVPGIIDEARKRRMRVSGHIPAFMSAEQAVRLGYVEVQHVNFLLLNFWADSIRDTRTPLRFTAPAALAAELDLDSPRVRQFIALLKERGIVVDPTVNVFETMFTARKGNVDPALAAVADRLPATTRRGLLNGGLPVPDGMDARYRASFSTMLGLVRRLYEAGVTIVPGTDAFAGFAYHRELELYVAAGIPSAQVLRMATLGAAQVAGRSAELGSVAPGKLADLVLVDGNPVERIADVRRAVLVVKNGLVYESASLYEAVGVAR
ncbi:MAG: amidohydrolase family protein [Gemmatimonadales bacterium]